MTRHTTRLAAVIVVTALTLITPRILTAQQNAHQAQQAIRRQAANPSKIIGEPDVDDMPMPARERYFELQDEIERLRKEDTAESRRKLNALYDKLRQASTAMSKETEALNKRIYESRQAELKRRARAEIPRGQALGFDVLSYPRVNGSTSAHPLGVLIACRLLGSEYEWSNKYRRASPYRPGNIGFSVSDRGSLTVDDYFVQYRLMAAGEGPKAERLATIINRNLVVHNGTHGAYVALMEKQADFALIAREPAEDELKAAAEKGVAFETTPVALDAFVFIVHRANPIRTLTTDRLKGVYTNKIETWKELGGPDRKITAYQRNKTSGSQGLMLSEFMKDTPIHKPDNEYANRLILHGMGGPYHRLLQDPHGIAYSVYYYEHFMAASPYTRPLAVDNVLPTSKTIRAGKYPYVTKVYAVIRKDEPQDSGARKLRNWLLTDEGQAVIEESGYVPMP